QGVIYLPNFQSWSENFKNSLIKMSLEYNGYWKINNPNGGLSEIYCPLTIIAASDNGAELVTSREQNGQRFGKPLTYEEIKIKSDVVRNDPLKLRQSILGANPSARNAGQNSKGTSESFLNLIPDDRLIYFDPLSPKDLRTIAENKLQLLKKEIGRSKSGFQHVNLMWKPSVVTFLQEYKYQAEAQGRPIEAKLRAMIENTLIQLFSNTDIVPKDTPVDLTIDVKKQEDKSWKLIVNGSYTDESKSQKLISHELFIEPTLVDRDKQPLTDAQIDKLKEIPGKLKKQIIGQQHALERIGKVILLNQEGRHIHVTADEAVHPAQIVTLFGPTSTGKTETSKVIAELTGGTRSSAVPVDCSSLQTTEQLMERIFGKVLSDGEVKKSDFMKTFDRNNGHVVLVLDELANVKDKDILTVLFDLFREATVSSFADRVPRVVSNVVIVITGNASQEILAQLPKDIPEDVKREVWAEIYNRLEVDHDFRRTVLEKYLTPPMIARLGEDNIFFYKPLNYSEVRELTQMKFNQMINSFESPIAGLRRWKIRIPSEKDYTSIIAALDTNGFKLEEQGASIETYIQKGLYKEIRETLLLNHVPDNDDVQFRLKNISLAKLKSGIKYKKLTFEITTSSGRKLSFSLVGKTVSHDVAELPQNTLATSAHEVGHTINKLALLSSVETPTEIRILPGLTMIDGNWIYYIGLATSKASAQAEVTREYLLREVATLLGGTVAENLVVVGGMDSAGRKNDLERATQILENWILKYGMSKSFGLAVLNKTDLSSRDKMRLNSEVQKLLKEAKVLSERSIIANKELFIALTNELAKKGQLNSHDIQHAVMKHGLTKESDRNFNAKAIQNESSFNGIENADHHGLNYRFVADLGLLPLDQVIDTSKEIQKQKLRDQKSVPTPDNAPIVGRVIKNSTACADLLVSKRED
ncbi:MAG: AAA family ATPase, partial [Bdellovibrionales bacterium]